MLFSTCYWKGDYICRLNDSLSCRRLGNRTIVQQSSTPLCIFLCSFHTAGEWTQSISPILYAINSNVVISQFAFETNRPYAKAHSRSRNTSPTGRFFRNAVLIFGADLLLTTDLTKPSNTLVGNKNFHLSRTTIDGRQRANTKSEVSVANFALGIDYVRNIFGMEHKKLWLKPTCPSFLVCEVP